MKKLFINFVIIAVATTLCAGMAKADNAAIKAAIAKYKAKNYVGCLQDVSSIVKEDPSDAAAYYYQALSYAQLGMVHEAEEAYNKVIDLNTNEALVSNATRGIACLQGADAQGCKEPEKPTTEDELDRFIKSDKFYSKEVQKEVNKKKLERKKDAINEELKSQANEPTDAEIAQAVRTLAKVGLNPLGLNAANSSNFDAEAYSKMMEQSNELAQLNMLMGNNNNTQNNLLPMLLMSQNGKLSPEVIQTMMMSSMNSSFGLGGQTY